MKTFIAMVLVISLAGCSGMSRQEVIAAVKECKDAGMAPEIIMNGWTYKTVDVICFLRIDEARK